MFVFSQDIAKVPRGLWALCLSVTPSFVLLFHCLFNGDDGNKWVHMMNDDHLLFFLYVHDRGVVCVRRVYVLPSLLMCVCGVGVGAGGGVWVCVWACGWVGVGVGAWVHA